MKTTLGSVLYSFFENYLVAMKGLSSASIRSYRDVLQLFLNWVAAATHRRISKLSLADLTYERVQEFLRYLEAERGNHPRTRNQRLAVLHTFFDYLASIEPKIMIVAERVAAIPIKRAAPAETRFLDHDEINAIFSAIPSDNWINRRDRTLLLFLYNTGARVQEAVDLRAGNIEFGTSARVRLHGKGDKWRICPLWRETADRLRKMLDEQDTGWSSESVVFVSRTGTPLTRYGIYKIVRRRTRDLPISKTFTYHHQISPHVFRHTTAVHLLEAGVEVNVIRGWLGHVSLDTTNRYAEIDIQAKENALRLCQPPINGGEFPRKPVWRDDDALLKWLKSL